MDVVAFHYHNLLRFSLCFSFSKNCYLGNSSLHMKEIPQQPSSFASYTTNSRTRSESSDQEEIIAFFRRIQISISKGGSLKTKKKSSTSNIADNNKLSTESLLDILDGPKKQVKGRAKGRSSVSRKEGHPLGMEFKLIRPPSNCVKKSPIPYPSTPRGKDIELTNEAVPTIEGGKQVEIEKLKLGELKAVAKSRRVKGYSKLKKDELIKLLRS